MVRGGSATLSHQRPACDTKLIDRWNARTVVANFTYDEHVGSMIAGSATHGAGQMTPYLARINSAAQALFSERRCAFIPRFRRLQQLSADTKCRCALAPLFAPAKTATARSRALQPGRFSAVAPQQACCTGSALGRWRCLGVSFREVVHSDRTEETGVTRLQHSPEGPNEHPQECPSDAALRGDGAVDH